MRIYLIDRMQHLVVEVLAHELVDPVVEGRGEQHPLSGAWGLVHDAGDDGEEAEVGHVVGLVEHGDFHRVERDELLLHEVFEATRAGHDDVDACFESCDLALLGYAAEDRGDLEAIGGRERLHRNTDLSGELASRGKHEAEWASGATLSASQLAAEARHHRNGERERLARTGLSPAEHVTTVQGVGQGVMLNRKR